MLLAAYQTKALLHQCIQSPTGAIVPIQHASMIMNKTIGDHKSHGRQTRACTPLLLYIPRLLQSWNQQHVQ